MIVSQPYKLAKLSGVGIVVDCGKKGSGASVVIIISGEDNTGTGCSSKLDAGANGRCNASSTETLGVFDEQLTRMIKNS